MKKELIIPPKNTARFDWLMLGVVSWMWAGVFLDGWAHNHIRIMETFFSPWHMVFYTGFFAVCITLIGNLLYHLKQGYPLTNAVPKGYNTSLIGLLLFGIAAVWDFAWHYVFGFEQDIDALLSPSHLLLAVGGGFVVWGIINATLERVKQQATFFSCLPLYIAVAYLLALLGDMTQYSNPLVWLFPKYSYSPEFGQIAALRQSAGASGIMLHTVFFMTLLFFLLSRKRLFPGAITLILTLDAALLSVMKDQYLLILPVFIAGVCSDIALYLLRPTIQQTIRWYAFSILVPLFYYSFYMLMLLATIHVFWSIHFWTGTIMAGCIFGFLIAATVKATYQQ